MPVPNLRIVVVGVPRADKEFEAFEVSKREAQRLARDAERDLERVKRELDAQIRAAKRR